MMKTMITLLSGIIFGLGLAISGMVNPQNVIGFLDITGLWNPSLILVIGGALLVFMPSYFIFIKPKATPVLSAQFQLNPSAKIDKPLIVGSILFGTGWGIAGICPGPAVTALAGLNLDAALFILFMIIGMKISKLISVKYM